MKEALVLCVISTLLPGLYGISCSHCQYWNATCNSCTGDYCIILQQETTVDQGINGAYRGCLNSTECNPISITLSTAPNRHIQISTACCASDDCNANLSLSVPVRGDSENGVHCPVCEKPNGEACNDNRLACTGLEEKCISLVGISTADNSQNVSLKGCASRNACSMKANEPIAYKGTIYLLNANATCTDKGVLSALSSPAAVFLPALIGYFLVNILPDL